MILLDTHVWVKWIAGDSTLPLSFRRVLNRAIVEREDLGVSIISCWEVALLVERGRLILGAPTLEWINTALRAPGIRSLPLTPEIAVASTELPGDFHRDPADRVLVATARHLACPMLTADARIVEYPHVQKVELPA